MTEREAKAIIELSEYQLDRAEEHRHNGEVEELREGVRKNVRDVTGYQATPVQKIINVYWLLENEFGIDLEKMSKMSIADIGCGSGLFGGFLSKFFIKCLGIEADKHIAKYGRKNIVSFANMDGRTFKIITGDVRQMHSLPHDILYTFMISDNRKKVLKSIIKNMKSGQIFIESHDAGGQVEYMLKDNNFSKVKISYDITIGRK